MYLLPIRFDIYSLRTVYKAYELVSDRRRFSTWKACSSLARRARARKQINRASRRFQGRAFFLADTFGATPRRRFCWRLCRSARATQRRTVRCARLSQVCCLSSVSSSSLLRRLEHPRRFANLSIRARKDTRRLADIARPSRNACTPSRSRWPIDPRFSR
jgi:hypothetical protein